MKVNWNTTRQGRSAGFLKRWKYPVLATLSVAAMIALPALAREGYPWGTQRNRPARGCGAFSELRLTLEQNATDGESEIVLFAKGQDEGLQRLIIDAPNRRRVADFQIDGKGVGLREFLLESAESSDLNAVLQSFPQGQYAIYGVTVSGQCLSGVANLSHQAAPATQLLTPQEEQVVPVDQLVLSWAPVAGAEAYIVELNNEETGGRNTFAIFPPTTSLAIPAHFLQKDAAYQFAVGVRTATGNLTSVETTFFTAP